MYSFSVTLIALFSKIASMKSTRPSFGCVTLNYAHLGGSETGTHQGHTMHWLQPQPNPSWIDKWAGPNAEETLKEELGCIPSSRRNWDFEVSFGGPATSYCHGFSNVAFMLYNYAWFFWLCFFHNLRGKGSLPCWLQIMPPLHFIAIANGQGALTLMTWCERRHLSSSKRLHSHVPWTTLRPPINGEMVG